jgi:hypothetical protein
MTSREHMELVHSARTMSDEALSRAIAVLEDDVCDARGADRVYVEGLLGVYEHVRAERAGLIDLYTGERIERESQDDDYVELPFGGDRLARFEVVS